MHCTPNGSPTRTQTHNQIRSQASTSETEPPNGQSPTPASMATTPPCLCEECQQNVLNWLRQYEREIETQAHSKRSRNNHLNLALAKHVTQHLRLLRRMLVKQPRAIVQMAKEMFEATEVNGSCD